MAKKSAVIRFILSFAVFSFPSIEGYAQLRVATPKLCIQLDSGRRIISLENLLDSAIWMVKKEPLFSVEASGKIETSLKTQQTGDGNIQWLLSITNVDVDSIVVGPTFPNIKQLRPAGAEQNQDNLYYLFPGQGAVADNRNDANMKALYCGNFPMQFLDVYDKYKGGFFMLCKDSANGAKSFYLSKKGGIIALGITYRERKLAPGETWVLPPVELGAHQGDWHAGFLAYCAWVKTWYKPMTPRKEWFNSLFNFRQVFLEKHFGEMGAFDPVSRKIDLFDKVQMDKKAFGGVDFVHIFDWSETPGAGRVGDYAPWEYLGGTDSLREEIRKLAEEGIKTGLYQEGYLISKKSNVGKEKGTQWQQLDARGLPYTRFGQDYYYPCPLLRDWRHYFASVAENACDSLGAVGVYVDEFGFGWQYGCYNPAHRHDIRVTSFSNALEVPAEAGFMTTLKEKLGENRVTYTEEMPTDVSTQFQDGSFTYAVSAARAKHNPSKVNLARFAFPDFKLFEILHVDEPLGNDSAGIKSVFFNGEGLWLEGPLSDPKWFPDATRRLIRKTYAILKLHKAAFTSPGPIPLVPTLNDGIFANYFPSKGENVWTLFNAQSESFSGTVLRIPHIAGSSYYDAWNDHIINPAIVNGMAVIRLFLIKNDVGCIVQKFK